MDIVHTNLIIISSHLVTPVSETKGVCVWKPSQGRQWRRWCLSHSQTLWNSVTPKNIPFHHVTLSLSLHSFSISLSINSFFLFNFVQQLNYFHHFFLIYKKFEFLCGIYSSSIGKLNSSSNIIDMKIFSRHDHRCFGLYGEGRKQINEKTDDVQVSLLTFLFTSLHLMSLSLFS